jgi:hypothetical protein
MHNKVFAAEYVYLCHLLRTPIACRGEGMDGSTGGNRGTNMLQDRPQRLLKEADRHHCPCEAIIRQGHQPQGEGHDRGLRKPSGGGVGCFATDLFNVSYGIRRSINGKGLALRSAQGLFLVWHNYLVLERK